MDQPAREIGPEPDPFDAQLAGGCVALVALSGECFCDGCVVGVLQVWRNVSRVVVFVRVRGAQAVGIASLAHLVHPIAARIIAIPRAAAPAWSVWAHGNPSARFPWASHKSQASISPYRSGIFVSPPARDT